MEEGDGYNKDNTKAKNPRPVKKAGLCGALSAWFRLKKHILLGG
jgi:hypothetical protein